MPYTIVNWVGSLDEEVERYVRTGEHDTHLFLGWPCANLGARGEHRNEPIIYRRGRPHARAESLRAGGPIAAVADLESACRCGGVAALRATASILVLP